MARLSVLDALMGADRPQQPLGPPVSPEEIKRRRRLADLLMEKGADTSPVGHWTQGAARVLNALAGAVQRGRADADERAGMEEAGKLSGNLLSGGYGGGSSSSWNTGATSPTSSKPITAPEDAKALIAQHVPEEMRDYMTRLIGKESGFRSDAVSPTGATGYVQFTKGTGAKYGLVGEGGDMRKDPALNLQAAVRFTNDNRNGLWKALGREPTWGEVALAHQQGLGGALNLLSGKSVAPGNLAVNNIDPNSDPRPAAQKIMAYYDMPGSPDPGITAEPGGVPNRDPRMMVASTDPSIVPSMPSASGQANATGFTDDELASLKKQGIVADSVQAGSVTPQDNPAEPTQPGKIMALDGGYPNGGPPTSRKTDDTRGGKLSNPVMDALVQYGPNPAGRSAEFAPVIAGGSRLAQLFTGDGPGARRNSPAAPAGGASGFAASPGAPMGYTASSTPQGASSAEGAPYPANAASGVTPRAPPQGGGMTSRMQQAAVVLAHPYSTPEQKAMAEMIYRQEMERSQPRPVEVGGRIVDANTGNVIYEGPQAPSYDYREVNGRIVQIDKATGRTSDITPQNMPSGYRPATAEERAAYGVAPEVPVVIGPDGKPQVLSGGGTSVKVDMNGGGSDKQVFDEMKSRTDAARQAIAGLAGLQEANKAIQAGGIFGAGANERLGLQKVAALFGVGDTSKIENTETFRSAIAPQVSAVLRATVGSANISNSDREFAEKAAGGAITLDESSIKRLMRIMDKAGRVIVDRHMKDLDQVYPAGPEGKFARERALFGVQMPPELPPEAMGPAVPQVAPQPQAAPGGAPTPSPRAVDALRSNPGLAEQFDQRYGPGAAQRALGGTVGPSNMGGSF